MAMPSTTELTLLIGVITTSIVTIINTVASHWGRHEVVDKLDEAKKDRQEVKATLDSVQTQTNGVLTKAHERISELEEMNKTLASLIEKRRAPNSVVVPDENLKKP